MYRVLAQQLINYSAKKVLVLLGPRQVGKTTLLKNIFKNAVFLNLEKSDYISVFNSRNLIKIQELVKQLNKHDSKIWILDEVQRLDDPGLVAKVIHDELLGVRLIISGSSSLEIANKASESLAGRKVVFNLFPLCLKEYLIQTGKYKDNQSDKINLDNVQNTKFFTEEIKSGMRYGFYPELLNLKNNQEKEEYLLELVDSVILKDVYYLGLVKNTRNLLALLKLLAYQLGGQVNFTDLSSRIGISRQTVVDYLEILKKTFIVFSQSPYKKNRRDEVGKMEKIFFYDLGLRNALIENFSPVEFRLDFGGMFENFVVSEIKKLNDYYHERFGMYYWRTKWGSEVDLVLYKDEKYYALEVKTRKGQITRSFKDTYPNAKEIVVTFDNAASLLLGV